MSMLETGTQEQAKPPIHSTPLWRNHDYWLLLSGQAISSAGTQVSQLAFPLLVLLLTHSPAQAGLMTALRGLPYALFCLPAGALVDRWNRKYVMIWCDTGRAIALGSIPIALLLGHISMAQLYLVSLLEGTLFVFFDMAESSAMPHIVSKEQLTTATGQNEVIFSSAILVGPSLGGLFYSITTILPFVSDAISYMCSALSLFFIRAEFQHKRVVKQQHLWLEIKEGFTWLWHNPLIRFLAILTCGLTVPCAGYTLILIVIAQGQHASAFTIGLIFGAGGLGSISGALLASPLERRFGFARVITGATWIWAISWLLYAIAPNPLLLGLANMIGYAIVPVYIVVQYSYRMAQIPDHLQGRVNSVFRLIAFGSQPIGLTLTGILLQTVGPVPTILLLAVPQFALAIATTLNRHVRKAPSMGAL